MAPLLEVEGVLLGRCLVLLALSAEPWNSSGEGVMLGRTRSRVAFEKQFHTSLGEATMSDNPFQAPQSDDYAVGVKSGRVEDLKKVAVYQKGILVCILINLIVIFGRFFVPQSFQLMMSLLYIPAGLAGTVFIFLLAMKVYNTGLGVLFGLLTFVPCLGLIILLVVNNKATTVLQQNGHKVGLLGADLSGF